MFTMNKEHCLTQGCENFAVSGGRCHDCISQNQPALVFLCPECNVRVIEYTAPYCPDCKTHTDMTLTVTDITEAMVSSAEGYAALVTDSMEFSLGRKLTSTECQTVFRSIEEAINKATTELRGLK
ncbi:hypothetical protein EDY01_21965 [Salmonella enterica]|nr:hypothetical protein [Salmonella enterica]